jgi:putative salt-induced outer membrane protein YdiY
MRLALCALLVCASASVLKADVVVMKNGDRVSGAVIKKEDKSITIKSEHFGTITAPWDQVQEIRTDEPINVQLSGGEIVRGKVVVREDRIEIEPTPPRQLTPADVVALRNADEQRIYDRLLRPGLLDLWAGGITFGFAGTQGNAQTLTLTTGLNAARITRSDKTTLYFNAIRATALIEGVEAATAQAIRGGWAYNRNVTSRLFVNVFNDYEYDRFQNLDLRFVLGGGLGYNVWKGERGRLDLLSGVAYNRERFGSTDTAPAFTRNSAEAYVGDDFAFKVNSAISLYQNARYFANLTDTGSYRLNFDAGANTRLFKWLTWNISISDRFLSNPLPGRQRNDFLYTTGIGVTFAR